MRPDPPASSAPRRRRDLPPWRAVRIVAAVLTFLGGAATVLGTAMIGHCGAFGGTCPSPDGLEGDVIGGLATGLIIAIGGPILAARPDRRGLMLACVVAIPLAVAITLLIGPSLLGG